MEKKYPIKITSISEWHQLLKLPKPLHPLVSLVDNLDLKIPPDKADLVYTFEFYSLSYKYNDNGKIGYGQGYYDFTEGGLVFVGPGQLLFKDDSEARERCKGYTLLFHRDFIAITP